MCYSNNQWKIDLLNWRIDIENCFDNVMHNTGDFPWNVFLRRCQLMRSFSPMSRVELNGPVVEDRKVAINPLGDINDINAT